jgi:hypothetical protein
MYCFMRAGIMPEGARNVKRLSMPTAGRGAGRFLGGAFWLLILIFLLILTRSGGIWIKGNAAGNGFQTGMDARAAGVKNQSPGDGARGWECTGR